MSDFRLPDGTHIGRVHLQVADLDRALAFYQNLLGFRLVVRDGAKVMLSATEQPPGHILLTERPDARPKPRGTTGLYHVAIRFANRRALASVFRRLVAHEWPFQGFADHLVSEALYLADPDGNGLELYVDRPRDRWSRQNGQIAMATDPLDVEGLLAEVVRDATPWTGVHPETDIGHVHLHVADLAKAEAFYRGLLGLEVTQRGYPGALFLSAGGYHHHLGVNTWAGAGASPPPEEAVGLVSFAIEIPDGETWRSLLARIKQGGVRVEGGYYGENGTTVLIRDPDRNGVELSVAQDGI